MKSLSFKSFVLCFQARCFFMAFSTFTTPTYFLHAKNVKRFLLTAKKCSIKGIIKWQLILGLINSFLIFKNKFVHRNNSNQTPYNKNQRCIMVYFIKIIQKTLFNSHFVFTFQNPSLTVKSIFARLHIKIKNQKVS